LPPPKLSKIPVTFGAEDDTAVRGSLDVAFKYTPLAAANGKAAHYMSGKLLPPDMDGPRMSACAPGVSSSNATGDAAAENTLVNMCAYLHALVTLPEAENQAAIECMTYEPHGRAIDIINMANRSCTLVLRMVRALSTCDTRPPDLLTPIVSEAEVADHGLDHFKSACTAWAASEIIFKLALPTRPNDDGLAGMIRDARRNANEKSTAVKEILSLISIEGQSRGVGRTPSQNFARDHAAELDALKMKTGRADRLIGCFLYGLGFDNLNFSKLTSGLRKGTSTGANFVVVAEFAFKQEDMQYVAADGERVTFDALAYKSEGKSLEEVKETHATAESFLLEDGDSSLLDRIQLARAAAVLHLFDVVTPEQLDEGMVTGAAIPGRAPCIATLARNPDYIVTREEVTGLEGDTMYDHMEWQDLLKGDLAKKSVVMSILEFVLTQLTALSTRNGQLDKDCIVWKAGVYCLGDGSPASQMVEAKKADSRFDRIHTPGGGFHWTFNGWRHVGRVIRGPISAFIHAGHRTSAEQIEYLFTAGNQQQRKTEEPEKEAARLLDAKEAFVKTLKEGDTWTAADLIVWTERRAAVCNLAYFAALDGRLIEMCLAMDNASLNGPTDENFAMYNAMQRLLSIVLAGTHATTYLKLGRYERLWHLTASELSIHAYQIFFWLRRTRAGQSCFADLWVELQMLAVRFYLGKKAGKGLDQQLSNFVRDLAQIWGGKGSIKNGKAVTTERTYGEVKVSKLLGCARVRYKLSNVNGHGGLESSINVSATPGVLTAKKMRELPCDARVCANGETMPDQATEFLPLCTKRAVAMWEEEVFGGAKCKPGAYAVIPTSTGDATDIAQSRQLLYTSTSVDILDNRKCRATGAKLFRNKVELSLWLSRVIEGKRHPTVEGGWVEHPAEGPEFVAVRDALKGPLGTRDSYQPDRHTLCTYMSNLRKEAGIKEVAVTKPKKTTEYSRGRPSKAALNHPIFRNRLAWELVGGTSCSEVGIGELPVYTVTGATPEAVVDTGPTHEAASVGFAQAMAAAADVPPPLWTVTSRTTRSSKKS
jgi:hypothetical protein